MKKIKFLAVLLVAGLAVTSCKKFLEEVQESPNDPTAVTPDLLLTTTEVATFTAYSGQLARQSAILTQHTNGTDFQYADLANYVILEGTNNNEWNSIYSDALMNVHQIIEQFGAENPHYAGIARILKALNLGLATDLWGDIPNSEAFTGLSDNPNFSPRFDTQSDVYAAIQTLLDEAINNLNVAAANNSKIPGADDLIHGGDVAKWRTTAYMLKARYYNHLSQRDASGSATNALAALTNAGMTGSSDDANAVFGPLGNELNQWYAFQNDRANYIQMGATFIDMMNASGDPRLPFFANPDSSGTTYTGTALGSRDTWTSTVGSYVASATSVAPLMTYVEAKFIEAEAKLRSGDPTGAATAHNEAVIASVLQVTGSSDSTYEATHASESGSTITLEKIMTEKYVALFTQVESYTDWRRTGFPELTPNPNASINTIPVRFALPLDERVNNANAPTGQTITTPVWWDN